MQFKHNTHCPTRRRWEGGQHRTLWPSVSPAGFAAQTLCFAFPFTAMVFSVVNLTELRINCKMGLWTGLWGLFLKDFYVYECVLACMLCAPCECNGQRPEEGVRCPETSVTIVTIVSCYVVLRFEPVPFSRRVSAFKQDKLCGGLSWLGLLRGETLQRVVGTWLISWTI